MGYIIYSDEIYGYGRTLDDACIETVRYTGEVAHVIQYGGTVDNSEQLYYLPATDRLLEQVRKEGGDIAFQKIRENGELIADIYIDE